MVTMLRAEGLINDDSQCFTAARISWSSVAVPLGAGRCSSSRFRTSAARSSAASRLPQRSIRRLPAPGAPPVQ
jgi:hypothetical protein